MTTYDIPDLEAQINVSINCTNLGFVLEQLKYLDWNFKIHAHAGWYRLLEIGVMVRNSLELDESKPAWLFVRHQFQVPYFPMTIEDLERWLFDNIMLVHRHEAMEHFKINQKAIFYPNHGDEGDPYSIQRRM